MFITIFVCVIKENVTRKPPKPNKMQLQKQGTYFNLTILCVFLHSIYTCVYIYIYL